MTAPRVPGYRGYTIAVDYIGSLRLWVFIVSHDGAEVDRFSSLEDTKAQIDDWLNAP